MPIFANGLLAEFLPVLNPHILFALLKFLFGLPKVDKASL